jgi:hypothetical protein
LYEAGVPYTTGHFFASRYPAVADLLIFVGGLNLLQMTV